MFADTRAFQKTLVELVASRMALSKPKVRDNPAENVFGLFNGDVFQQSLSNFTIQYVYEVRAAAESGFIC